LRRLSNVVTQRKLMTDYPDQPWIYRKVVRQDIQKHPHTEIKKTDVGLDRTLDAFDQRRLNYFAVLGKATQSASPTLESIHRIEEFARPYDPVLSYFLHHELATLYSRAESSDASAELRHRLHAVYYSDTRDRSVRDVVEALRLLSESAPSLEPALRWDHMNALLEFLKIRWANRGFGKPESSRIALNDLEKCIDAAESAFAKMDQLHQRIGISQTDWNARRDVLEQTLVRPLRSYRTEILPYYLGETHNTAEAKGPLASEPRRSAN
jgi:hypothetical protein